MNAISQLFIGALISVAISVLLVSVQSVEAQRLHVQIATERGLRVEGGPTPISLLEQATAKNNAAIQTFLQSSNQDLLEGTDYEACNETCVDMSKFWRDDVIGNLLQNIGQLVGRCLTDTIDGPLVDFACLLLSGVHESVSTNELMIDLASGNLLAIRNGCNLPLVVTLMLPVLAFLRIVLRMRGTISLTCHFLKR